MSGSSTGASQEAVGHLDDVGSGDNVVAARRGRGELDQAVIEYLCAVWNCLTRREDHIGAHEAVIADRTAKEPQVGGHLLARDVRDDGAGSDEEISEAACAAEQPPLSEHDVVERWCEDRRLGTDVTVGDIATHHKCAFSDE